MSYSPPPSEPEHLSPEYHKAHKQVMLWSGMLILWDILDIDLALARSTEGSVGPIISAIKNPRAVPWVLLGLIVYFLIKLLIEWAQCNEFRRSKHASVVDFGAAWFAALGAAFLYWLK
jgi:hypothetical protein